jgi:hypothetical protein
MQIEVEYSAIAIRVDTRISGKRIQKTIDFLKDFRVFLDVWLFNPAPMHCTAPHAVVSLLYTFLFVSFLSHLFWFFPIPSFISTIIYYICVDWKRSRRKRN